MKRACLALTLALAVCAVRAGEGIVRTAERPAEAVGWTQTAFAAGDVLVLRPFDGVELALTITDELPGFGGARTYAAALPDGMTGSTLVVGADGLYADVRDVAAARLYRIAVRNGVATAEEIDLTAVRRGGCIEAEPPDGAVDSTGAPAETARRATRLTAVAGNPFDDNVVAPAPVMVDIMLVFDNGARAWVESSAKYTSITNFAVAQVAKMNSVLLNTGLHTNFWYRLVDVMTVDTTYTVIDENILGIVKAGAESGDGPYGPIKERRAACGADLVSLMIDTGKDWGTTGIGYITHGTTYNTWLSYRAWCYSCCAIRSVDLEYTLSHEVGHNMGLAHSPTLASWTKPGTFDYSNGYNFTGGDKKHYHTIMAYNYDKYASDYIEIPYFSSPDHTYQGTVIGTVLSNDCTRALRETCAAFAAWHETAIPLPSDVTFSPSGGEAYRITLSNLGGYEIRYTTDGSEPTRESTLYTEPIMLTSGSVTINAVAVVDDNTLGAVAEKTYKAAAEIMEYAWLEAQSSTWAWGDWNDQDGKVLYSSYWNTSADKTAIIEVGGAIALDRDIELSSLIVGGAAPLEIAASDYSFSAKNLNVFGDATLAGEGFSFENWKLHKGATLQLAPGEGKSVTLDKYLALGETDTTLAISNGTLSVTRSANSYDGIATLQNCALRIDNGGVLSLTPGWVLGYANPNPVTVNEGGLLQLNGLESTTRPLVLNGGNVEVYKADNRGYEIRRMQVTVTDNSTIADKTASGVARMSLVDGDSTFTVSDGKTLTVDMGTYNEKGIFGIVKKGLGEVLFLRELGHLGTNTVSAGTFTIGYNSTTTNCANWIVAKDATLKVANGCLLVIPQIDLSSGAVLELPAASAAPLAVSNSVALAGVALKLQNVDMQNVDNISYGKEYPLITASGAFTGTKRMDLSNMPSLNDGFAWQIIVDGDTLKARVAATAETVSPVPLTSNNDSLAIDVPSDATRIAGGGATINSNPIAIDNVNTKVVAVTIDVEIPEGEQDGEKAICSWNLGGNIARCVRMPSGLLDCYYSDVSQTNDRATEDFTLSPGRHLVSVMNYSISNEPYGGTYIYVDGVLAYRSAKLRWADYGISRFTIGATAHATPRYVYDGLNVYGVTVLDLTTNNPLSGMTASGCSPSYGYFNGSYPTVFGLPPSGGFMMNATNLVAALDKSADSISVSVIASFPSSAKGTIFAIWTRPAEQNAYSTAQAEYSGDGTFFLRYNGNTYTNPFTRVNDGDGSVDEPHLYTLTYSSDNGVCFYQDGIEILHQDEVFKDSGNLALYRVNFGCGAWSDNPNPMPDFKVYASHIALGTDDRRVSENAVKESYSASNQEESDDPAPPATPAVVDILVAYDNGAQAYVTNKGVTLEAFAQTQINKMNDVLVTNKLDRFYSYRLAGTCKVDATYSTVESVSANLVSGAGPLVTLRAARELCGADTVTLLVKASGGATLGDSIPLSHSTDVASRHDCAFSVCSISAVDTGTQHTMIHENAHNMGCGHARKQSAVNSPFEYGRGYYFMDGTTKRHTIMAYDVDGTGVYAHPSPYFSTTSKEFGFALGDETNNNARVLKETCGEVAKWRESVVPGEDDVRAFDENGNEILSDCFFNDSLKVTVVAPVEGAELYYTFDGSEPVVDDEAWHQTSPFTFNFTVNRTLKIAYKSGETLSPVRTIRFTKTDNVPTNGLWQTCLKYPWTVEGDAIRSFNQTDYTYQCTTPLKATVAGPKRLSFKHKSYFGGVTQGGDNHSHFDVLLDDSPVLAQTECTNAWTETSVDIPGGTHDVVFVFSQRFAMNNHADNKDVTPEADDAVWLKDFPFADLVLNIPADETVALSDVAASVAAITGEGTLSCGAELPDAKYGFTNATWKGTVAFEGLAANASTQNLQFELYGNAGSKVRLTNCAINYLMNNNATFSGTLELVGSAAFSTANGYSSNYNVFGALDGSGSMSFSGAPTQAYIFNTASNFTGSISVNAGWDNNRNAYFGRRIVFGRIASAQDLPGTDKSASITVKSGATAAIGAGATWYAYHGVDIAGVLIVKGAGATLNCEENGAALGLALTDGATLRFETADAKLIFGKAPRFATGTVKISFADGVTPASGATLVSWPEGTEIMGTFELVGKSGYELETTATGLVFKRTKPADAFDIPGTDAFLVNEGALATWLADDETYQALLEWNEGDYSWRDYLAEKGLNGYPNWTNFLLGLSPQETKTFQARIEIKGGKVVVTTTEGEIPEGYGVVKRLFRKEKLDDPWPTEGNVMTDTTETLGDAAASGFYKVSIEIDD